MILLPLQADVHDTAVSRAMNPINCLTAATSIAYLRWASKSLLPSVPGAPMDVAIAQVFSHSPYFSSAWLLVHFCTALVCTDASTVHAQLCGCLTKTSGAFLRLHAPELIGFAATADRVRVWSCAVLCSGEGCWQHQQDDGRRL